jgi:hypothetical protein
MAIKGSSVVVSAWQIVVPIGTTPRSPKSRIKIEFANVPSYDNAPRLARITPGLVQMQDVILAVESQNEILADKAVALTARETLKYRDVWDVWGPHQQAKSTNRPRCRPAQIRRLRNR